MCRKYIILGYVMRIVTDNAEEMRKFKVAEKQLDLAQHIYNEYLAVNSANALNINTALIQGVAEGLQAQNVEKVQQALDNVLKQVEFTMTDSHKRFIARNAAFKAWQSQQQAELNLGWAEKRASISLK